MRMMMMAPATAANAGAGRLTLRDNSNRKGTIKWKMTKTMTTHCQPPRLRRRYHEISSGKFARPL